jgi:hypothetical protein
MAQISQIGGVNGPAAEKEKENDKEKDWLWAGGQFGCFSLHILFL